MLRRLARGGDGVVVINLTSLSWHLGGGGALCAACLLPSRALSGAFMALLTLTGAGSVEPSSSCLHQTRAKGSWQALQVMGPRPSGTHAGVILRILCG